jgi:hypothetical protein
VANDNDTRIAQAVGIAAGFGATWLARKAIDAIWQVAAGHTPPQPGEDEEGVSFGEVLVAAVISGAVVALFRALATHGAAKALRKP